MLKIPTYLSEIMYACQESTWGMKTILVEQKF